MAGMTLDDIVQAADSKFGPFVIAGIDGGDVTLLNPIRLPKDRRQMLTDLQKLQDDPENADTDEYLRDMVRTVAASREDAERLLAALGDDNAKLAVVLQQYGEASRLGEASPSAS